MRTSVANKNESKTRLHGPVVFIANEHATAVSAKSRWLMKHGALYQSMFRRKSALSQP